MRQVIVRYRVKKERLEEHEGLVRTVFKELAEKAPPGIRYAALKQADGVSFVHVAFVSAAKNPLDSLAAFAAFTAKIGERCDEPPKVEELTQIGAYGL